MSTPAVIYVASGQLGPKGPPGGVDSVNGQDGDVVLTAADVDADPAGTADAAVTAFNLETTNVHGIVDTSALLDTGDIGVSVAAYNGTDMATQAELDAHTGRTTAVHGIADAALLLKTSDIGVSVAAYTATDMATQAELNAHSAATTGIHGIADTNLLLTTSSKLDDLAAPDDNTDLNATTSRHGLLRKLSGVGTEFLNGLGTFSTPAGGGGGGGGGDLLAANNLSELASAATARTNLGLGTAATTAASAYEVAGAAAAAQAASQPVDSDLTAIAALSTTSYGRAFLALADAAAGRTALGLGTAATTAASAYEVAGAAAAAQAASQPLNSDLTAIAALTTTAYGRAFLGLTNQASLLTLVGTASTTATGVVELATTGETTTGTDATRATTPAGVAAAIAALAPGGGATSLDGLSDVATAGQTTGDVLTFDGTGWIPDPIVLNLSTATAATPATGDYVVGTDVSNAGANAKFLISEIVALATAATNLVYTPSPTNGVVASDTGTDATLTLATGTNAGLLAPADFTKLGSAYVPGGTDVAVADGGTGASTAAGARTNLGLVIGTDVAAATAVARANHTGTQLASTISDLSTAAYVPSGTDVALADGGTGASTASGARTNLGLVIGTDVQAQGARVTFSNAAYTVVATSGTFVAQTGTMSASRAVTLPAASAFRVGDVLTILDESGTVTATNTIVVTRAGADTIGGATTVTIAAAYGWRRLVSDGVSKWSFDGGVLRAASNLSDLTDAAAARTNLGLGTAATTAAADYATAAQGATADAAVPKSLYDANTVLYATTDNTPAALTVAASTIVGRKASGNIAALTGAETGALIALDELGAPTDITTRNASTTAHGLLKKLSNVSTEFLNGQGNWATPAGGLALPFGSTGGGSDFRGLPGYDVAGAGGNVGALSQYDIYTFAIFVDAPVTLTGWDINVQSGQTASTVFRLAVFASSGSTDAWQVGALVNDTGTVSTAASGAVAKTGLSVALSAGWYQIAFGGNAAALVLFGYPMVLRSATHCDLSGGTGALKQIRWWYDYTSSPDYPGTGFPTPLSGNSQPGLTVSANAAKFPVTLRWTNP